MYRLFSMSRDGRLYQLNSQGWSRTAGTNMPSVQEWRGVKGLPPLPCGQFMQDTYIAQVDPNGLIVQTFPLMPETTDCEG